MEKPTSFYIRILSDKCTFLYFDVSPMTLFIGLTLYKMTQIVHLIEYSEDFISYQQRDYLQTKQVSQKYLRQGTDIMGWNIVTTS